MAIALRYRKLMETKKSIFLVADDLRDAVVEYFEWCEEHPLLEEKVFNGKDGIVTHELSKMRVFTKTGLATWLGITDRDLDKYKKLGSRLEDVIVQAEQIIRTQKFEGAAAGLLNATMITRSLGLTEKSEVKTDITTDAPPITIVIEPVARGTFLPDPEKECSEPSKEEAPE